MTKTEPKSKSKTYPAQALRTCKQPDRDVPALVCGYPMPCPHHTVMIEERDADLAAGTLRWLVHLPNIAIGVCKAGGENGGLEVRAIGFYASKEVWRGSRLLPITVGKQEIRDAFDELTREGIMELEKR